MKAEDIRQGDEFLGEGAHYTVIADAEIVPSHVRVRVRFSDGGLDYRHFEPGQDVPLVRPPTVRKVH